MRARSQKRSDAPRRSPLAACLALALGVSVTGAGALEPAHGPRQLRQRLGDDLNSRAVRVAPHAGKRATHPSAMAYYVDTCADDNSAHSLRTLVGLANSGDTIYLTQLPMACSTITLDHTQVPAYIEVNQYALNFVGPADRQITIDGDAYQSSIIRHHGAGTLSISHLTLTHGKYISADKPKGGCVYSSGNVSLTDSTVSHCALSGTGTVPSLGGGIYVARNLYIANSIVTGNVAHNVGYRWVRGGGINVVGDLTMNYTTISSNTAYDNGPYGPGVAGGIYGYGDVAIAGSTISGNKASIGGALEFYSPNAAAHSAAIKNSTISGNASAVFGTISTFIPLELSSSTVAFNHSTSDYSGGIYAWNTTLTLKSSMIAGNSGAGIPYDIGGAAGVISGSKDLVAASALALPADTITDCPQLEPLLNNGGRTLTHGLRHTSRAIDNGFNPAGLQVDQRGAGRVAGSNADIGAFEWHGEPEERVFVNGFDGLCDQ